MTERRRWGNCNNCGRHREIHGIHGGNALCKPCDNQFVADMAEHEYRTARAERARLFPVPA